MLLASSLGEESTEHQTKFCLWLKQQTGHSAMDWFKTGKGVRQGCTLLPCLFNLYAKYITGNAGLDESQARI